MIFLKATFCNLQRVKGSTSFVQGVKERQVPYNAVAGQNGSFYVQDSYAQLNLTVKDEEGNIRTFNIKKQVLDRYKRKNLNDELVEKVKRELITKDLEIIDGEITW